MDTKIESLLTVEAKNHSARTTAFRKHEIFPGVTIANLDTRLNKLKCGPNG